MLHIFDRLVRGSACQSVRLGMLVGLGLVVAIGGYAPLQASPLFDGGGQDQPTSEKDQETEYDIDSLFGGVDQQDGGLFGGGNQQNDGMFGGSTQENDKGLIVYPVKQDEEEAVEEELLSVVLEGVPVEDLILQISEWTGKPVFADKKILRNPITLVNGEQLPKSEAINLIFIALSLHDIAVIDRERFIAIIPMADIQQVQCPIFGAGEDISDRLDTGMVAEKVYQIAHGNAANIAGDQMLKQLLPRDAKIVADEESNQIIVRWTIGTLQHVEQLIRELDAPATNLILETFILKFTRAEDIANMITELFGEEGSGSSSRSSGATLFGGRREEIFRSGGRPQSGQSQGVQTTSRLRVTFDKRQNAVYVLAEAEIVEQIRENILTKWDLPTEAPFQIIYNVTNNNAVKMKEMLDAILSGGEDQVGTTGSSFGRNTNFGRTSGRSNQRSSSSGTGDTVRLHPLAGLVSIQADEAKQRLIVISRSQEYLDQILELIKELDQPAVNVKPEVIELVHAEAWALSDILNVIFAPEGAQAQLIRGASDLSEGSIGNADSGSTTSTSSPASEKETFPWQGASASRDDRRKISPIIGEVRIVPYAQRNALLVLAPPEHRAAVLETIDMLDKPVRQVLIQAIIAEVSDDAVTELGFRWGGDDIGSSSSTDNMMSASSDITGEKTDLLTALFDTSVLSVGFKLNALLQLLRSDSTSNVLSAPKVVTSDNEEAIFFDGQDVPFITDSNVGDIGGISQSFEYREVGIRLAVRPHITKDGNVDLRVDLQLASVVPGQTLFGGFILDKRTTSTKITIRDGQTVVISGIMRDQFNEVVRKVPLLGDIPLLGALFRSKSMSKEKTQLVAFIRPIVLDSLDDLETTETDDHNLLRELGFDPDQLSEYGQTPSEPVEYTPPKTTPVETGRVRNEGDSSVVETTPNDAVADEPKYWWSDR